MLIETIVTLFIVGFVAVAGYGHVLVARALLSHKDGVTGTALKPGATPCEQVLSIRASEWMPKLRPWMEIVEMNRIMTPAATIISIIAVFTALNLMWVKREMSMILAKEMPERTGGPPIIAPFDIMLKRAKNLPLEDWGPAH